MNWTGSYRSDAAWVSTELDMVDGSVDGGFAAAPFSTEHADAQAEEDRERSKDVIRSVHQETILIS